MNPLIYDTFFKSRIPNVSYRLADTDDAAELLKVYEPYVNNTAITYEYEVPSVEEFASRISDVLTKFPYIDVGYELACRIQIRHVIIHCGKCHPGCIKCR